MKEHIESIEEIDNYEHESFIGSMEGYEVKTNEQTIFVLIRNEQSCCESFGYLSSFEDKSDFIGAKLIKVDLVDKALNKKMWSEEKQHSLDEGDIVFVNFETDKGTFQLAVYNAHNGYYGHSVLVKSEKILLESCV